MTPPRLALVSRAFVAIGIASLAFVSTASAQGGIPAVLDAGDTFEEHIRDTMIAGAGLNRQETVEFVIERAEEVFENFDLAIDWLKSGNTAMAGFTPMSLLDTDIGAESVMDTLGRIEHGVFA